MNSRERFLQTLRFGVPDRVPYHDREIRADVIERWRGEGLPSGVSAEEYFDLERWELVSPREAPRLNLAPVPDFSGTLRSASDFRRLKQAYDPATPGRYPTDWTELVRRWRIRDYPLGITVWRGMFLPFGVRDFASLRDLMYAIYDFPEQLADVMQHLAEFTLAVLDRALNQVQFDFAVLGEPIASWHAPVVGPGVYRRYVLPTLRRLVARLHAANIDIIVLDTHGAVTPLLPAMLEAGANTLWLGSARAAGVDYRKLRCEFGRELRLIGGLDVRALDNGPRAIRDELQSVAAPLLKQGGYVPMVDERIRSTISFQSYSAYRRLLQELVEGA
jgi:hypothetical protein